MKKVIAIFTATIILVMVAQEASAHPGNTAADGCHYCRTNCDKWGVPWNERHCHGGKNLVQEAESAPSLSNPTNTPVPTRIVLPTNTPTPSFTPTPTSIPTPTVMPTEKEIPASSSEAKSKEQKDEGFLRKVIRFLFGI